MSSAGKQKTGCRRAVPALVSHSIFLVGAETSFVGAGLGDEALTGAGILTMGRLSPPVRVLASAAEACAELGCCSSPLFCPAV